MVNPETPPVAPPNLEEKKEPDVAMEKHKSFKEKALAELKDSFTSLGVSFSLTAAAQRLLEMVETDPNIIRSIERASFSSVSEAVLYTAIGVYGFTKFLKWARKHSEEEI